MAQLVQDAASADTVRQQEAEHAFDMDKVTSTLSNLSDNVWGPIQLQRIVACCAFLHAHNLVEYTPPEAGVNDLAMAVRTRTLLSKEVSMSEGNAPDTCYCTPCGRHWCLQPLNPDYTSVIPGMLNASVSAYRR
jgi:hypothetical protein